MPPHATSVMKKRRGVEVGDRVEGKWVMRDEKTNSRSQLARPTNKLASVRDLAPPPPPCKKFRTPTTPIPFIPPAIHSAVLTDESIWLPAPFASEQPPSAEGSLDTAGRPTTQYLQMRSTNVKSVGTFFGAGISRHAKCPLRSSTVPSISDMLTYAMLLFQ